MTIKSMELDAADKNVLKVDYVIDLLWKDPKLSIRDLIFSSDQLPKVLTVQDREKVWSPMLDISSSSILHSEISVLVLDGDFLSQNVSNHIESIKNIINLYNF